MAQPRIGEYVKVVDNETMRIVALGRLDKFTRSRIDIIDYPNSGGRRQTFDAKTHHFQGYEPPVMFVKRDGKLIRKESNGSYTRRVFDEINTFDWQDLDGKKVKIRVNYSVDGTIVLAEDVQDGKLYVLHHEINIED